MTSTSKMLVVCALAAATAHHAAPLPGVDQVFARHERAAVARLKTLVRKGYMSHGERKVPFEWRSMLPGQWHSVSIWPGRGPTVVAFDGKAGWRRENRSSAQPLSRDEAAFESFIHDIRVLSRLKNDFPALSAVRTETREGRQVQVITARRHNDADERILPSDPEVVFDSATGLLVQLGPVRFDDYREVGVVKLAHRISFGEDHMVYIVTEVLPNVPLDPGEFKAR